MSARSKILLAIVFLLLVDAGLSWYFIKPQYSVVNTGLAIVTPTSLPVSSLVPSSADQRVVFTQTEFTLTQVKIGQIIELGCSYQKSLDSSPEVRGEVVFISADKKLKTTVFTSQTESLTPGNGRILFRFPLPSPFSPGTYKAVVNLYTLPDNKLIGGCGTAKFIVK